MSDQASLNSWNEQIRLEGYKVVSERRDTPSDPVRLTLAAATEVALCPHRSRPCDTVHRRTDSDPIRDLPHGVRQVELVIRSAQFRCGHCERFFAPACPHVAPGVHATERFLEQAARLIRFADFANAASLLGVPEKTLGRWYYDYAQRQLDRPEADAAKPIKSLGIDELSLRKVPAVRSGVHRPHQRARAGRDRGARRGVDSQLLAREQGGAVRPPTGGDLRHVGRLRQRHLGGVRRRGEGDDRPLPRDEGLPGATDRGAPGDPARPGQGGGQRAEGDALAVADQPGGPQRRTAAAVGGTEAALPEVEGTGRAA